MARSRRRHDLVESPRRTHEARAHGASACRIRARGRVPAISDRRVSGRGDGDHWNRIRKAVCGIGNHDVHVSQNRRTLADFDRGLVYKTVARTLLGLLFIAAGVNHFAHPGFYERIVPPPLPSPALLVVISGVAEIAGGLGVLIPATRKAAGIGLVALLIAVFPANVYMAQHPELF